MGGSGMTSEASLWALVNCPTISTRLQPAMEGALMSDWLKVGVWRHMLRLPPLVGKRAVGGVAKRAKAGVGALSEQHRTAHHFVVRELPRLGEPLPPLAVPENLRLPLECAIEILDELETKKAFLFRDDQGAVVWAYPVTVEETPHRLSFRSGERLMRLEQQMR